MREYSELYGMKGNRLNERVDAETVDLLLTMSKKIDISREDDSHMRIMRCHTHSLGVSETMRNPH